MTVLLQAADPSILGPCACAESKWDQRERSSVPSILFVFWIDNTSFSTNTACCKMRLRNSCHKSDYSSSNQIALCLPKISDVLRGFFSPRRHIPSDSSRFCAITKSTDALQTTAPLGLVELGRRDRRRRERHENWGQQGRQHDSYPLLKILLTQFEFAAITNYPVNDPPSSPWTSSGERQSWAGRPCDASPQRPTRPAGYSQAYVLSLIISHIIN